MYTAPRWLAFLALVALASCSAIAAEPTPPPPPPPLHLHPTIAFDDPACTCGYSDRCTCGSAAGPNYGGIVLLAVRFGALVAVVDPWKGEPTIWVCGGGYALWTDPPRPCPRHPYWSAP